MYHKKYKLHCKTLSPVHIGSGEILSRWEYILFNDQILKPNDKFWKHINKKYPERFNSLVADINQSEDLSISLGNNDFISTNIRGITLKKGDNKIDILKEETIKQAFNLLSIKFTGDSEKIRNINLFSGSPNHFIPGSSIKGAIRTGVTVNHLNKCLSLVNNEYSGVEELQNKEKEFAKVDSPISKNFQSIYVSDVVLNPADMLINPVSYLKDDEDFQLYETLSPEISFTINITNTFYKYDRKNTDFCEVFQQTTDFYKTIWNKLKSIAKDPLDKFYSLKDSKVQNSEGLLRVGFGAGQLSNSILHFWKESGKSDVYLYNGNAKRLNKEKKVVFDPYPSTVKQTNTGLPLGWVLIEKIETC